MIRGELIADAAQLEEVRGAWDDLAQALGRPYAAPGWMISWWRHAAPAGARLRTAAAWDADELVGLAPLWAQRRAGVEWLRPLAGEVAHRSEPFARPGREAEVAHALAAALAGARPAPHALAFEAVPAGSPWPELLAGAWPGPGRVRREQERSVSAPYVTLTGGYDEWFAGKSSNFRSQVRRARRKLEAEGARFVRIGDLDAVRAALGDFSRLHHARWDPRGGSGALNPQVEAMLATAAADLAPRGRLCIWAVELGGRSISSHLFVEAGDEVVYWLGGHDDEWAAQRPGLLALVAAIEGAFASGATRVDLGPGEQDYKYRLADGEAVLDWITLRLPGRPAVPRAALALRQARLAGKRRLTPEQRERVKGFLRRA